MCPTETQKTTDRMFTAAVKHVIKSNYFYGVHHKVPLNA